MLPETRAQTSSRTRERLPEFVTPKDSRLRRLLFLGTLFASGWAGEPAADKPDISLPPVSVKGIHVKPQIPSERMKLDMQLSLKLGFGWPHPAGNFLITPSRVPQAERTVAFTSEPLGAWINMLRAVPWDEPVRPRGLPALVLRDGLLIADPFDGSVPWSELPQEGMQRIEEIPAGGGAAWGASATGGVAQLFTREPLGKIVTEPVNVRGRAADGGPPRRYVLATGAVTALLGELGTRRAEAIASYPTPRGVLQILGGLNTTDGAPVLSENQRGAIDETAWHRGRWLETRWRQPVGADTELLVSVRTFENSNGAGTRRQTRQTEGADFSITLAGSRAGAWAWNGALYAQTSDARGSLSSIDANRSAETPALRLTGLPASRVGASWAMYWWHPLNARTIFGADLRLARGEVREEFAFLHGNATRERIAGGAQNSFGGFVLHERSLGSAVRATFGARLETSDEHSARFRDIDRASALTLRDEHFASHGRTVLIPSAGVVWSLNRAWRLKVDLQATVRPPTLAEHYQTWGEPGTITVANPQLSPEKNTSFEATLEYESTPKPTRGFGITAFQNRLRGVIASQAFFPSSSEFPGIGLLPDGLSGRRRLNLDRAEVRGLVLSGHWRLLRSLTVSGRLEINDSTILDAPPGAANLVGKRLARLGDRTGSITARWQPAAKWTGSATVRTLGRRFADEENALRLGDAILLDLGLSYQPNAQTTFSIRLENATDERAENSRDTRGLVYLGTPRVMSAAIRFAW